MKRRILIVLMILIVASASLFATRIGITYKDTDYIISTTYPVTAQDTDYFAGYYDAFTNVKEGRQLYELQQVISSKVFANEKGEINANAKTNYIKAFTDFMDNYAYGSIGKFSDLYPVYDTLMQENASYKNSKIIVEYGSARFYLTNM